MRFLVLLLFLALSFQAWGAYKCMDDKGRAVYQQQPCAGAGKEMEIRQNAPATPAASTGGLRDSERSFLEEQQAEDRANKIEHWERRVRDLKFERDQEQRDHDAMVARFQTGTLDAVSAGNAVRAISRSNEKLKDLDSQIRRAERQLRKVQQR